MHPTSGWNRELFAQTIAAIQKETGLSQADLGMLAGRARTQINRWTRAENQPAYDAVSRLAAAITARFPDLRDIAEQLMSAAGYGGEVPAPEPTTVPEPVVVEIPEDASPAERAGLSAIQALLDAQQREIANLRSEVDDLKRRHDAKDAADDNGGRRTA